MAAVVGVFATRSAEITPEALRLGGAATSAQDAAPVELDADLYLPATDGVPAPAVLLAHGFGGSKASVADQATFLADAGFVVLAYSARGFGESTGEISVNSPEFEVADASALIDHLATLPEVRQDAPGDPRVGIAGGSYGGALALLAAGYDDRVDAIAADITWNSLQESLFGESGAPRDGDTGVYKSLWTGLFFSSGLTSRDGSVTECGRFTPAWCRAYVDAAVDSIVSPESAELMRRSSPVSITDRITVPTLLGGGQADSLFPLGQANATAEQIRAAHPDVPVKVVWHAGGHDGSLTSAESVGDEVRQMTADWFTAHLDEGAPVADDFLFSVVEGSALSDRAAGTSVVQAAPVYPGVGGAEQQTVVLQGPPQQVLAPPGGVPAAISSLPGLGGLGGLVGQLAGGLGAALGGDEQTAVFTSEELPGPLRIVGSSRVTLTVSSDRPVEQATLFTAVRIIDEQGRSRLPAGLVAPVQIRDLGSDPVTRDITLPAIVADVPAGARLAVTVTTTDQAYRMPPGPAVYRVSLAADTLAVPLTPATPIDTGFPSWGWLLIATGIVLGLIALVRLGRPRTPSSGSPISAVTEPVRITGLVKEFPSGVRAVDDVSFTVPEGAVLGLLGPNGAGKSTTLRMLMGLTRPTAGSLELFGQPVQPGTAALARVGCFIEGPGLLPHLTGRQNLDLFWRASGREGDPRHDEVLDIAGLGPAIDRRVRTYSQGMKQRLGIAQAMLGMPDLLVLDEPMNGLDPPQIKQMRETLRSYAQQGRTVIVSSHLLSEVEQTCSHVIVMGAGRVIAAGTVSDLLSEHRGRRLEDVFLDLVGEGHDVVTRRTDDTSIGEVRT